MQKKFFIFFNKKLLMKKLIVLFLVIILLPIALVYGNPQLYYRPLQDGTQIYNVEEGCNCSIGFASYYTEKTSSTVLVYYGIVTASRCGDLGDHIYQPNNSDPSYYIGTVQIYYPRADSEPNPDRKSDSMWVYVETKESGEYPSIVSTRVYWDGSKYAIADKYARSGDIEVGQHIEKVGRTTGLTTGEITSDEYWRDGAGGVMNTTLGAFYGDSGGIVYFVYEIVGPPDHPTAKYVIIYGVIQGGIPGTVVTWFCSVYHVTDDLDVVPYTGGAP